MARPERFRTQFIEGRNPGDIRDDIRFAFKAAGALRRPDLLVELILSLHEIYMRTEALGDAVFDAYVNLGELHRALGLLQAEEVSLSAGKGYELVDAFLSKGDAAEGRKLFHQIEPLDKLFGSKPLDRHSEENGLSDWAERALVFRTSDQFLASLARLRASRDRSGPEIDIDAYRTQLKLIAARGELERTPNLSPDGFLDKLQIGSEHRGLLLFLSVRSAFQADDTGLVTERLESALQVVGELEPAWRSEAALIAARSGRLDLALRYLEGVPSPTLAGQDVSYSGDDFWRASRQIIMHAQIAAWLGMPFKAGQSPPSQLFASYQSRLETLGRLLGDARRGSAPCVEPLQELRQTLDFLEHATGTRDHDSERWRLDEVIHEVVAEMVNTAAALGEDIFARFVEGIDKRLAGTPRRVGRSAVRRSYALVTFDYDHDAARAELRLAYDRQGIEQTPSEQLAEAARAASVLFTIGMEERARAVLADMHTDGLGYSRPAKKDAQYVLWRDLLTRACEEDASGRPDRLRFLGRLLAGMAKTEGDGAGGRVAPDFLAQAAQAGAAWARVATDLIEEIDMARWPGLVSALVRGVVKGRPDLTAAAGVIFGRLALPWTNEHDRSIYPQLIGTAPAAQVESVVRHAVTSLETDSHPFRRNNMLQEVVTAAKKRRVNHGAAAVARWSVELLARETSSNSDDPFAAVGTLEELDSALAGVGDKSSWGAARAFERVAPESDYEAVKALYECTASLRNNERSVDAVATAALAAGRRQDAMCYLAQLKQLADERGDWSAILRGDAKKRFHRLSVKISGETARRAAFDAFVDDLVHGRESVEFLLPELCEVLELLSPQPTWANAWLVLQNQLSRFREYRFGGEPELVSDVPDGDEQTLADVLYRAVDTTSIDLARMARAAALELTQTPGGAAIVGALLPRLWRAGGHHALEAVQIAWECRDSVPLRDAVVPWLSEMFDSEDCAVRRTAISLASAWGRRSTTKRRPLPPSYTLMLPPNPQSSRFEPPSGASTFSSGLWTEDPFAWTWPLEDALRLTARVSDLELANLRARAAQLMRQTGGKDAFGPEAIQRQLGRLDRLGLRSTFRKLGVTAAFHAMRRVVGELEAAEAIDPGPVRSVLRLAGDFAPAISTMPPSPRPRGVPCAAIPDFYRSEDCSAWIERALEDAVTPSVQGYVVLASTAVHKRRHFQDERIIEQYTGPDHGGTDTDLSSLLGQLPRVIIIGSVLPLYEGPAEGAVVYAVPDIAGSTGNNVVMLCPVIASLLNWRPGTYDPFTYRDSEGNVVAQTLRWRDGGVVTDLAETSAIGRGCVLLMREDHTEEIRPFLLSSQTVKAWRISQKAGGTQRVVGIGSRELE
ncbi:MAG: hypothetical protein IPK66_15305 [Rhodospirillales bacterium]|nr:hypothetical protein [Rhodospirillales bacterium]